MFDSLKEKLGSFREDVEEQAEIEEIEDEAISETDEEAVEGDEVVPEEIEDASKDTEDVPKETEDVPEADENAGEVDEERAEENEPVSERSANAAEVNEGVGGGAREGDADTRERDADTGEGGETDTGGGSTGLTRKARSFARGRFVIEEDDLEDPLWDLEMALLESDVEMGVAEEILDGVREELVGETRKFTESTSGLIEYALREALLGVIDVGQFDFDATIAEAEKPVVVIFTGVNGVGKTTSIAKLVRYLENEGYSSVIANGDTYRAGANEQIREHAANLGVKLIAHEQGGDPAAVIYDAVEYAEANDVDVVLGDTAGRLHTSDDLMAQLEKIDRVVDPDMTLFVDEAVAGQDAVNRAREFDDAAAIDGAVLTKADADSQGGAAISVAHVTGKPILFLGTGQGYDDVERFDPEEVVGQLLGGE
jgi:fused signal recognition particle receptor